MGFSLNLEVVAIVGIFNAHLEISKANTVFMQHLVYFMKMYLICQKYKTALPDSSFLIKI